MPLLSYLELENSLKINQLLSHLNPVGVNVNSPGGMNLSGNSVGGNMNNFTMTPAQAVAAASSILATNNQLIKTANGLENILQLTNSHAASQQMLFNQQKLLASKLTSLFAGNGNAAAAAAVAASILNANVVNGSGGSGAGGSTKQINYSRYKTELCRQFTENGECKYSDKCQFAHGLAELKDVSRHPKYKTDLCKTFHSKGFCPYGPRCHFLHEINEHGEPISSGSSSVNSPAGGSVSGSAKLVVNGKSNKMTLVESQLESIQSQLENIILANGLKNGNSEQLNDGGKLDLVISTSPMSSSSSSSSAGSSTSSLSSNMSQAYGLDELALCAAAASSSASKNPSEHFYRSLSSGSNSGLLMQTATPESPSTPARTRSNGSSSSSNYSSSSYDYFSSKQGNGGVDSPQQQPIGKPQQHHKAKLPISGSAMFNPAMSGMSESELLFASTGFSSQSSW